MRRVGIGIAAVIVVAATAFLLAILLPRGEPGGERTPVLVTETTIAPASYSVGKVKRVFLRHGFLLSEFDLGRGSRPPGHLFLTNVTGVRVEVYPSPAEAKNWDTFVFELDGSTPPEVSERVANVRVAYHRGMPRVRTRIRAALDSLRTS
jgi:hypothetical protein